VLSKEGDRFSDARVWWNGFVQHDFGWWQMVAPFNGVGLGGHSGGRGGICQWKGGEALHLSLRKVQVGSCTESFSGGWQRWFWKGSITFFAGLIVCGVGKWSG